MAEELAVLAQVGATRRNLAQLSANPRKFALIGATWRNFAQIQRHSTAENSARTKDTASPC